MVRRVSDARRLYECYEWAFVFSARVAASTVCARFFLSFCTRMLLLLFLFSSIPQFHYKFIGQSVITEADTAAIFFFVYSPAVSSDA